MTAKDRRFASWLAIGFGPLFVLGGFAFAFTIEGAVLAWLGVSMLLGGGALRTRLSFAGVVAAAATLFVGLASYTLFVYP